MLKKSLKQRACAVLILFKSFKLWSEFVFIVGVYTKTNRQLGFFVCGE